MRIDLTATLFLLAMAAILPAAEPAATPVDQIHLAEGFRAELLYSVPGEEQGSWVNMTPDPQGRLIVSDQYGSLYRVTPGADAASTKVERLKVEIGAAQGLLCAFDSLYVMVNGESAQGSGLYRLRDTNGDDQYDDVRLLRKIDGRGEHGPHAIVLSPDGKSLYVCAGNHTKLGAVEESLVPRNWQEDLLLPRMWDAGGHAVGILAPGGWVCRTDPDGKQFELVSIGYRNQYDMAFNSAGELFTFDSDMEWDIGAPWYRPTRVSHITSGSDFGWRSGSGNSPSYFVDQLPAAVDIGPGSPTGITFGAGARFPEKYRDALFIADWSYGLIYAVHLESTGSTYTGTFERFATASPLPVTDIVINPADGAMYFTIGGRRTQSGLYRVTYTGSESTRPSAKQSDLYSKNRVIRRQLEAFHGHADSQAVADAWPFLSHADRFIRYAARVAIEHQPVESWTEQALSEKNPMALLNALVALAHSGQPDLQPRIVSALSQLEWDGLTEEEQLALLRVYALTFARMGTPDAKVREAAVAHLDRHYPARSQNLNAELSQVLIYLEAPEVVGRTLKLMAAARTQEEQIHYAFVLRTLKKGWTLEQRGEYFAWFNASGAFRGGHSFAGFLRNARNEAIDLLTEKEKGALKEVLNARIVAVEPDQAVKARPPVKQWQVDDLASAAEQLHGRSFERGRELFAAATCFKCHRFDGQGGIIGPDLTGVGKRFNNRYLLESLIEPSKVVSDQYQATIFVTAKGQTIVGKVANLNGDNLMVITNMLDPGNLTSVPRSEIEEQNPSPVSMMPNALLDTFHEDEILDLLAYLKSGGDPNDSAFKP